MLVRRLVLQNFKNHRDLDWNDIDAGCNVLLGKNGQGKSNIHIALLYLFSDLYGSGGMAKKRELLSVYAQFTLGDLLSTGGGQG